MMGCWLSFCIASPALQIYDYGFASTPGDYPLEIEELACSYFKVFTEQLAQKNLFVK